MTAPPLTKPPDWFAAHFKILNRETMQIVPFVLNPVQRRFRAIVNRQRKETGMFRGIVCKPRKEGVSTIIAGIQFRQCLTVPHYQALTVSHDDESTRALFRIVQTMNAECPIKRETKFSNRSEIEFAPPWYSAYRIRTASSEGVGRGDTRHGLHLSELAYWPESFAADALQSILSSVHDVANTFIAIESTACGIGGPFYDWYKAAEAGQNGYEPIFFSFLEDPHYRLNIPLTDARWKAIPVEWLEDEPRLREHGADDAQLAWRRWIIGAKCGGSLDKWYQDYPATAAEAFVSAGRQFFPASICSIEYEKRKKDEEQKPVRRYTIDPQGHWVPHPQGPLRSWSFPVPRKRYLITADVAQGKGVDEEKEGGRRLGDFSVCYVFDQEERRVCAKYHARLDPDEFGEKIYWLGKLYNDADVLVEANNWGVMTIKCLLRMNYPRVCRREITEKATITTVFPASSHFTEAGQWTTPTSRPLMLRDLEVLIRDRQLDIPDEHFWKEALTFRYDKHGKPQAQRGCYDDRVMAVALAAHTMINDVWAERRRNPEPEQGSWEWFLRERNRAVAAQVPTGITL